MNLDLSLISLTLSILLITSVLAFYIFNESRKRGVDKFVDQDSPSDQDSIVVQLFENTYYEGKMIEVPFTKKSVTRSELNGIGGLSSIRLSPGFRVDLITTTNGQVSVEEDRPDFTQLFDNTNNTKNVNNDIVELKISVKSNIKVSDIVPLNKKTIPIIDKLVSDGRNTLKPGEYLLSRNGRYKLFQQTDGNVVITRNNQILWSAVNKGNDKSIIQLEPNGNIALYNSDGTIIFKTTFSTVSSSAPYNLQMQDNGNLELYDANRNRIWDLYHQSEKTVLFDKIQGSDKLFYTQVLLPGQYIQSQDGNYKFVQEMNGNAVLYENRKGTWATGTNVPGSSIAISLDGNVVQITKDGKIQTKTQVAGTNPTVLIMQNDGNLVLQDENDTPIWTRTLDRTLLKPFSLTCEVPAATDWNDEGGGNVIFLDRHFVNCDNSVLGGFNLKRRINEDKTTQFHYEYKCCAPDTSAIINQPISKETPFNEDGGGNMVFLDRHNIDCGKDSLLSSFRFSRNLNNLSQFRYDYTCKKSVSDMECVDKETSFQEDGGGNSIFLDRQRIYCDNGSALSQFKLKRNPEGNAIKYVYRCCKPSDRPGST